MMAYCSEISKRTEPPNLDEISGIENSVVCIMDLETTSLYSDLEIVQIAAVQLNQQENQFNQYVLPVKPVNPSASEVNGITKSSGNLLYKGNIVESVDIKVALERFATWLREFNSTVVLVGHNMRDFDANHFLRIVKQHELQSLFYPILTGFVDTLRLFKALHPNKESHKQQSLYYDIVGKNPNGAHNALNDTLALATLLEKANVRNNDLQSFSYTASSMEKHVEFKATKKRNLDTFEYLIDESKVTKRTCELMAASGLCYNDLEIAHSRNPENGIRDVLCELYNGVPRVKVAPRATKPVIDYFKANF